MAVLANKLQQKSGRLPDSADYTLVFTYHLLNFMSFPDMIDKEMIMAGNI